MTESEEYIMMTLQISALRGALHTITRTPWWKVFTICKTASAAKVKSREIEDRFRRGHAMVGPFYSMRPDAQLRDTLRFSPDPLVDGVAALYTQQVGRAHRTGGPRYTWFGVEL